MATNKRPTKAALDVARFLHRAYRNHDRSATGDWPDLYRRTRESYTAVAEQLLLDPPLPLRKRVRELEGN